METVMITGGTGLVGKALSKALLSRGYHVIVLSRNPEKQKAGVSGLEHARWDIAKQEIDKDAVAKADHIIHLAGAGVADKRWTKKRKKEIVDSRIGSSGLLVKSLAAIPNKVRTVVSASAIGWYGPDPLVPNPFPFTEALPASHDFLGSTCKVWEKSILPVTDSGKRLVILRTGIVLSREGGALKEFIRPLQFGIASVLGNGKQVISWIHIQDMVEMYIAALTNDKMSGIYNAVAPNPVTNRNLIMELARIRNKWFIPIRVPVFLLRWVLGEMSVEILKSVTISCKKILATGFQFKYPGIKSALANLTQK